MQSGAGWTYEQRDGSVESYDPNGRLTGVTDAMGLLQTLSYDAHGRLETVTDAFGYTLGFAYNASGKLSTLTQPGGATIAYAYTGLNLTSVTYPDGGARIYHYENGAYKNHLTGISHREPGGATTRYATYTYDAAGRASTTQHAGGAQK